MDSGSKGPRGALGAAVVFNIFIPKLSSSTHDIFQSFKTLSQSCVLISIGGATAHAQQY